MSFREEGIVASLVGNRYLIATKHGICVADRNAPIKLGDSVTFTRTNQVEPFEAFDIFRCKPVLQFKETNEDYVLLKVTIENRKQQTRNNRLVFKTDFFQEVLGKPNDRDVNNFIGKAVYVKYCFERERYFWEIQHVVQTNDPYKQVTGFAYNYRQSLARVYVPGYPNDFLLRKSKNFMPDSIIGKWVRFTINTNRAEADSTKMVEVVEDLFPTRTGLSIKMPCSRHQGKITTSYNDSVHDPENQIDTRDFQNVELWLELAANFHNKPNFIVHGVKNTQGFPQEQKNNKSSHRNDAFWMQNSNNISNHRDTKAVSNPSKHRPYHSPVSRPFERFPDEPPYPPISLEQSDGYSSSSPRSTTSGRSQGRTPPYEPTEYHGGSNCNAKQYDKKMHNQGDSMINPPRSAPQLHSTTPPLHYEPRRSSIQQNDSETLEHQRIIIEQQELLIKHLQENYENEKKISETVRSLMQHQHVRQSVYTVDPQSLLRLDSLLGL